MQNPFELWIGQRVVVRLVFGQVKVSLHGVLLRDLTETLLMEPEAGPNIEIAKTKILAIEEVERASMAIHCMSSEESYRESSQSS